MPQKSFLADTNEQRLVDASPERTLILVVNNSEAGQVLYVSPDSGEAVVRKGIPIPAGGNLEMSKRNGYDTAKEWYVTASAGLAICTVTEGFSGENVVQSQPQPVPPVIHTTGWM